MRRLLKTTTGDPVTDSNLDRLYRLAGRLGPDHGKPIEDWLQQIDGVLAMLPEGLRPLLRATSGAADRLAATPDDRVDALWLDLHGKLIRELDQIFDAYESGAPPLALSAAVKTRPKTLGEAIFDQTTELLLAERETPRFRNAVAELRRIAPAECLKVIGQLEALSGESARVAAAPMIGRLRQFAYEQHHRPARADG